MQSQKFSLANCPLSLPCPTFFAHIHTSCSLIRHHATLVNHKHFQSMSCNLLQRADKSVSRPVKHDHFVKVRCGMREAEGGRLDDESYIRRCVELARKAAGHTSPNPMVGCVIVKDGQIVGEGFHPKAGQPHAEVFALRDAGDLAEGATAYVSLEPCNHYGRTPPCTEALIKAKVKKVVIGMVDPNPLVYSTGIDRLRDAGIEVIVSVEDELCKRLNDAFIHRMLSGKPFLTLRYSLSVNGCFVDKLGDGAATAGGYYSRLLQEYDAVILPASLAEKSSSFTSQEPDANQPLQIIVASFAHSTIPLTGLTEEVASKTIVFAHKDAVLDPGIACRGIETILLEDMDLNAILEYCKHRGLLSVLLDLRSSSGDLVLLLRQGMAAKLIQKVFVELLPIWIEKEDRCPLVASGSLVQWQELKNLQSTASGQSIVLEGYL